MKQIKKSISIVLIGYMGSGKSTIGKVLSDLYSIPFVDLDNHIEAKEGKSVSEIFGIHGELHFRKLERLHLLELTQKEDISQIIALGGGTPCYYDNMKMLNEAPDSITYYLKASLHTIVSRVFEERRKRPLISHLETKEELLEFIAKHLFERTPFYEQAKHIISTDSKKEMTIANEIVKNLA